MTLDRISLASWMLCLVIALPLFQTSTSLSVLISLAIMISFIAFYFVWSDSPERIRGVVRHPFFLLIGGFVLFHGISAFFHNNLSASLEGLALWFAVYFLSVTAAAIARETVYSRRLASMAVACGALYFFFGVSEFFTTQPYFLSVFYNHNLLGGALLIPLFLCLSLYSTERHPDKTLLLGAASVLMLSSFITSFSRGSILSFLLFSVIAVVLYRGSITKVHTKRVGLVLLATLVIVGGAMFIIKPYVQKSAHASISTVYEIETEEQNAVTARLSYYKTALNIARHAPLFGIGLQNYRDGANTYRQDMEYFSADPHNSLLRAYAEGGLIGGTLFLAWFLFTVWNSIKLGRNVAAPVWHRAVAVGVLASMFHSLMDVDWYLPVILFIFTIFSALIAAWNMQIDEEKLPVGPLSNAAGAVLLILGTTVFLWQWIVIFAGYQYDDAQYYQEKEKIEESRVSYHKATRWYPYTAAVYASQAEMEHRQKNHETALSLVERAIELDADYYTYWALQADIQAALKQPGKARQSLKQAIALNPKGAVKEAATLVAMAFLEKDYQTCIEYGEGMIQNYPARLFQTHFWEPPRKEEIRQDVVRIHEMLAACYKQTKNAGKSSEIQMLTKEYEMK